MKTKQSKEELEKSTDEDTAVEPKTRARKKADEEDKNKTTPEEPKTSKEPKKNVAKPKAIIKKKPMGIRKALRSKKAAVNKETVKKVIKPALKRGRKPAIKTEPPESPQEKETLPLIPVTEIKKEPVDETTPTSRSSSPRTAGRRSRLTSDIMMMKSVLSDSPSSLVVGPRTSPYSMRSERSNSPSIFEGKNLRSGKPRKAKANLLNEVVIKEQKKRRRLLSDSKTPDLETTEECKKIKRGRSCSRDGSEISKCSDITESDLSLSESLNETDAKELNKKLDKAKTDLDIDIENNVQISSIEKVPSLNDDSKLAETKPDTETCCITNVKNKKIMSLQRSTSLDSDNNNSNRLILENLNTSNLEDRTLMKTENDTLFEARSSILDSMSKTFNSKEVTKNIRKARRGRKAATATRTSSTPGVKNGVSITPTEMPEEKQETLESLSKEIDDLINNLDQNIHGDLANESNVADSSLDQLQTKPASKFHSTSKALSENNSIISPETNIKDTYISTIESSPSKLDDSENIRLHYEDDIEKQNDSPKQEITFKCNVASIDKLMDRLKEFEEFDKRRQRLESETKSNDGKSVMVTNDVVLIPKSGADIKLKDIQTVRSPEKPLEKENVLSCFENNSAISIVKRDHQVRKSIDVDLPNSVTLIKRNSISSRKESTSSNHSKETDAISIFEKSLGKDVTLTEIRKSVDKTPTSQVDLHQFATLQPNNSNQSLIALDTNQISILPRVTSEVQITKRNSRSSRESLSRKSSESGNDVETTMAVIEKIKSPKHQVKPVEISVATALVAVKSPEAIQPMETEALAPPLDSVKPIPEDIALISKGTSAKPYVPETAEAKVADVKVTESIETAKETTSSETLKPEVSKEEVIEPEKTEETEKKTKPNKTIEPEKTKETAKANEAEKKDEPEKTIEPEKMDVHEKPEQKIETETPTVSKDKVKEDVKETAKAKAVKGEKSKSARNSIESQPGPSNAFHETPETQKRKENVLRTLGLLTHKAAKEAKIEKLKEKERIYGSQYGGIMGGKSKAVKSGSGDYTGTLKTVIKLNRGAGDRDKKKYRSSLKMTFQKSKHRGKPQPEEGQETAEDDAYYTIERREGGVAATSDGGHRKSYSNRLNNHEGEAVPEPVEPKETLNLVIPEKASSFSIHPGRLCMDQCFYCGGKFGLFDTPCHIAQMKSSERQKKVLANEEKLTIDSCLCDACYRHVDRRANCPSYRKRPAKPLSPPQTEPQNTSTEKPQSPPEEEESEEEPEVLTSSRPAICHTTGCVRQADHSIRRKWLIKMRASVNKLLKLEGDYPGLHTIPLCGEHHRVLAPLLACALCRRKVTRHQHAHLLQNYIETNPLLSTAGLPVQFEERPVLCKLCRYYCSLLQRPNHNPKHAANYRRKLLQIYNIEVPPEEPEQETQETSVQEDLNSSKTKKKARTKSKQRKSSDPDKQESESSEKTESSPEKEKTREEIDKTQNLEEDIESLISSNKIPVPGANKITEPSDTSESEANFDYDMLMPPIDKQTELQYLLQKQNNPAQFLHNKIPNLSNKQKNLMKIQNTIQKPGHQHRIFDKNAKKIQKIGQMVVSKEKQNKEEDMDSDKSMEGATIFKNISLNDECTIESIPPKKPADINQLKNKWQMSESFTQVKKNISELSKKLVVEKEPKKNSKQYLNPVKRLETNPSISVRELFPGEEEMNLQCNIEFNNVKSVTPEGWEKCKSTIQYDVETKRLWNDLQRPYGNQSSFLRHLILLEKYFRNGDLVLSQHASPHAANYSDSVQSRLRAYDNVVNDTPRRAEPAISLIEFRKKPSVNGKSLLKTSQNESEKEVKKTMPPPGVIPKPKPKGDKPKKQLPPELIAINTPNAQGRKAIQNVLHNIQQLVKGVSASDPTEVAAAPLPPPPLPPPPKVEPPKEKEPPKPSKDTPTKKGKITSKPWRPKLMPITPENMAKIAREPTQVAVDGRHLPSLVQVMSSGKRYHITLQDYNKMCIMRREKLQQLQEGDKKKTEDKDNTVVTEIQPSATLGNGGTLTQNIQPDREPEKKEMPELTQISSNAANILKNVGLKNITIAPIPPKTATVTSLTTQAPVVSSPSLLVTSTPIKLPQLGSSVSITSETVLTPNMSSMTTNMIMPKIPKSLTVIPQVVTNMPPGVVASMSSVMSNMSNMNTTIALPQSVMVPHGVVLPQNVVVPHSMSLPQGLVIPQMVVPTSGGQMVPAADVQHP